MNNLGRDCGRKCTAFITRGPTLYPESATVRMSVEKSLPLCEVIVPTTFSRTTNLGFLPSVLRFWINFQKGTKVPLRFPLRPAPDPANERSWQGKEAQARSAVPGN